jgi:hypothetical protein
MSIRPRDFTLFLYNFGVTVAGGWVTMQLGPLPDPVVFGVMALLSVGWTIYFRYSMVPRLAALDERATERTASNE